MVTPAPNYVPPLPGYAAPSDGSETTLAAKVYLVNRAVDRLHEIINLMNGPDQSPSTQQPPQGALAVEVEMALNGLESAVGRLAQIARITGQVV